jgi:hypothetical protein
MHAKRKTTTFFSFSDSSRSWSHHYEQLVEKRWTAALQMVEAITRHDCLEIARSLEKLKACIVLSPWQACRSARTSVVAAMLTSTELRSMSSQINFSLWRSYLSAVTGRC